MSALIYLDTGEIFETDEDSLPVGDPVATLQHAILDDDAHALGTQMAAAPELFEALTLIVRNRGQLSYEEEGLVYAKAFDAIAKATPA